VNEQYRRNMYEKEQLEFDWSDKKEAEEIGVKNAVLHNGHPNKQFFPGVANMRGPHADPHLRMTAEEWAQASHNNLLRAESERLASKRLRALVDIILYETARDLRQQADRVEVALERHILTLIEALRRQEEELSKTLKEIVQLEKMCNELRDAIRGKDDYLKVAQTRLHNNTYRPNREDRVDTTQDQLVKEVMDISAAIDELQEQLAKNQVMLDHLRQNQLVLEKDIEDKRNNIFIDREKVLHHRKRYPTIQRLLGQTNCV
jgi:tektin-4